MTRCISQGNLRGGAILYSLYIMIKNEIGEREIIVKKEVVIKGFIYLFSDFAVSES